jgi:hypothetical protein
VSQSSLRLWGQVTKATRALKPATGNLRKGGGTDESQEKDQQPLPAVLLHQSPAVTTTRQLWCPGTSEPVPAEGDGGSAAACAAEVELSPAGAATQVPALRLQPGLDRPGSVVSDEPMAAALAVSGAGGDEGSGWGTGRTSLPIPMDVGEAALAAGWATAPAEVVVVGGARDDGAEPPPRGVPRLLPPPPRAEECTGSAIRSSTRWRRLPTRPIAANDPGPGATDREQLPARRSGDHMLIGGGGIPGSLVTMELPGTETSPATGTGQPGAPLDDSESAAEMPAAERPPA